MIHLFSPLLSFFVYPPSRDDGMAILLFREREKGNRN